MNEGSYSAKAIAILDAAERHMRQGGYDAVSFRDLAAEVGIKSASVHYHFPQKADLGEAVVRRYAEGILKHLAAADDPDEPVKSRIERLCETYRRALEGDGLACLCCVLGAEVLDLPLPVTRAVRSFFDAMLAWTAKALKSGDADNETSGQNAALIVASLQGAMILALTTGRSSLFTDVTHRILASLEDGGVATSSVSRRLHQD